MHQRYIPEWLRHPPRSGIRNFAILAGAEAVARGMLISVFPLAIYGALGDARIVSAVYFATGIISLIVGFLVPTLTRLFARRFVYGAGTLLMAFGGILASTGSDLAVVTALVMVTVATVMCFVCFNAYVLDFVAKTDLSRSETSRLLYSALGWTIGPVAGVTLYGYWTPAPFLVSAAAALTMLGIFTYMRLGDGRMIVRVPGRPAPRALAFLPRFASQKRLVAGWLFAVIRSCGWWVYVVYLPIFALEQGLGDRLGGMALSITNAALFLSPFMLAWMNRHSIRAAVRTGFAFSGLLFAAAALLSGTPMLTVLALMAGSFFLILLDIAGGLPFLLAVKPSERPEMSAVYASFRDISGIVTPGVAWLVLLAAPIPAIFAAMGAGLGAAWWLADTVPARLGQKREATPRPA